MTHWQPPDNLNFHEVLHEGVRDTRDGNYEVALAKFLWVHDQRRLGGGVRTSFALSYWFDLAKKYPPAFAAFYSSRDYAERQVYKSPDNFSWFRDLAAFNRKLKDFQHTADVFKRHLESQPDSAQHLYHVAEPALIKVGEFALCNRFLDPVERVQTAADCFHQSQKYEKLRPILGIARKHFTEDVTTLVTLLVLNRRQFEARSVCTKALETLDDADFRLALETAMTGHFPTIGWEGMP